MKMISISLALCDPSKSI